MPQGLSVSLMLFSLFKIIHSQLNKAVNRGAWVRWLADECLKRLITLKCPFNTRYKWCMKYNASKCAYIYSRYLKAWDLNGQTSESVVNRWTDSISQLRNIHSFHHVGPSTNMLSKTHLYAKQTRKVQQNRTTTEVWLCDFGLRQQFGVRSCRRSWSGPH